MLSNSMCQKQERSQFKHFGREAIGKGFVHLEGLQNGIDVCAIQHRLSFLGLLGRELGDARILHVVFPTVFDGGCFENTGAELSNGCVATRVLVEDSIRLMLLVERM